MANGAGIPPQLMEVIFDIFAQGERTIDRSEGGLGIGLTLAKRIVVLHGGSIDAKSAGAGQGSEFIVRLPFLDDELLRVSEMASEQSLQEPVRRQAVLVVDDNEDAATSTAALLRHAGHDVDVVHDGRAAVRCLEARRFDVMLLDIGLPGMSGYDVARRLRELPVTRNAVFIALTGYGQREDRDLAAAAGFQHHFTKPADPRAIHDVITRRPRPDSVSAFS